MGPIVTIEKYGDGDATEYYYGFDNHAGVSCSYSGLKYDPQFTVTAKYTDDSGTVYEAVQLVTLDVGGLEILDGGV